MDSEAVTSRKAGLTFQSIDNAHFAVSHAERTELHEPDYLLPVEHRLQNKIIYSIGTEDEIAARFEDSKARMTAQAKRASVSPFWEGVAVLPDIEDFESTEDYHAAIENRLMTFRNDFERETGCKVLQMSAHLDEGVLIDGVVKRNPHAHILVDRTISPEHVKKRAKRDAKRTRENKRKEGATLLWSPGRGELARMQSLYADCIELTRGSTHAQRGGKPARKHIPHQQYREIKNGENELLNVQEQHHADVLTFVTESAESKKKYAVERAVAGADLKAAYGLLRGFLKGSGLAKQADYKALKKLFEEKSPLIAKWAEYIDDQDKPDAEQLLWSLRGDDLELLSEKRTASAAGFAGGPAGHLPATGHDDLHAPLKRWHREHADLYLLPEKNAVGKRLAFEDQGDRISIKLSSDFAVVEAALKLSAVKWPNGFEINGNPEFKRFAADVAATLGLENLIVNAVPKPRDDAPDFGR